MKMNNILKMMLAASFIFGLTDEELKLYLDTTNYASKVMIDASSAIGNQFIFMKLSGDAMLMLNYTIESKGEF